MSSITGLPPVKPMNLGLYLFFPLAEQKRDLGPLLLGLSL